MKRCLLNIVVKAVTVLSAVLFVAVSVLWVRSYWAGDVVAYDAVERLPGHSGRTTRSWTFVSANGDVTVRKGWQRVEDEFALGMSDRPGWSWGTGGIPAEVSADYHFDHRGYTVNEYDSLPNSLPNAGVRFGRGRESWRVAGVRSPYWAPAVVFLVLPLLASIRLARRGGRRSRSGACARCGYNLTGNVSGTCPECGAVVETAA